MSEEDVIHYKQGKEVAWNMGDGYYRLLEGHKRAFQTFFILKDAETLLLSFKAEYVLVYPYLIEFQAEVKKIENFISSAEKLIYIRKSGGRVGEERAKKNLSSSLNLLFEAQKVLNVLEAKKGLLQPKAEDPLVSMRKYGD